MHDDDCDDHDHPHHDHHDHQHDDDIKGVALSTDRPVDPQKVTAWLNDLLARQGPDILRAKGILSVKGDDRRLVFQAVHMILEGDFQRPWRDGEDRSSRMVFIGRNLDEALLRVGFSAARPPGTPGALRRQRYVLVAVPGAGGPSPPRRLP